MANQLMVRWRLGFCGLEKMYFVSETAAWYIAENGQKFKKVSRMGRFYDTKLDALNVILATARDNLKYCESALREARRELAKARADVEEEQS